LPLQRVAVRLTHKASLFAGLDGGHYLSEQLFRVSISCACYAS
jgi:hypothetical protein